MANDTFDRFFDRRTAMTLVVAVIAALALAGLVFIVAVSSVPWLVTVPVGVLVFAGVLLFANMSVIPLGKLTESARRVTAGELGVRVDLGSRRELSELSSAFNSMVVTIQQRTEDLTQKVDELTTLYETSRALGSTLDLDTLLDSTLDAAMRSFAVDSGYLVLRDSTSSDLKLRAWRGTRDAAPDDRAVRSSMSEWVVRQGRPLIFNPSTGSGDAENVDVITGALAAVCVPLHSADGVIGAIAVGSRDRNARFTGDDVRLLSTIANHLTVAIGNTELYASLQDAYLATVRSLAAAVDAKEPHMRGHSERVAVFSGMIAENMGLSHEQCTALEMAAYLHDIGKIGISGQILRKAGPLDEDELATMRHHPLIGANILRPVAFPWSIGPVVRHHHERYDGGGYPAGLRGEEIPILARVLAVADAYEAMIADRPYRKSLTAEGAVAELTNGAGTQFDPRVVESLIEVLRESDAESHGPERVSLEVDRYEARAVFVSIADGMLAAFRRLGGPRLTANLETSMAQWLAGHQPAFSLSAGHLSAHWDRLGDPDDELSAMRVTISQLGDLMATVTGRSLVDHFYSEAVEALTERLRASAFDLNLYRQP
ncbi:MAG TPA: HD domain-containing phosphohydrolase [Coriobacteriia bacterium]